MSVQIPATVATTATIVNPITMAWNRSLFIQLRMR
jgi:hypothetical protein